MTIADVSGTFHLYRRGRAICGSFEASWGYAGHPNVREVKRRDLLGAPASNDCRACFRRAGR